MSTYTATAGVPIYIPTPGLELDVDDLDDLIVAVDSSVEADPDLSVIGTALRCLRFVPSRGGTYSISFSAGEVAYAFVVQTTEIQADPAETGTYIFNIVAGTRVVIYRGSTVVTQGTASGAGAVSFLLPLGSYTARFYKDGTVFAQSTVDFVVTADAETSPVLYALSPGVAAIGDVVLLSGGNFSPDCEIVFHNTAVTPVCSADGRSLAARLPAGLTVTAVPVRVRKPDPEEEGEFLLSATLTLVRSS